MNNGQTGRWNCSNHQINDHLVNVPTIDTTDTDDNATFSQSYGACGGRPERSLVRRGGRHLRPGCPRIHSTESPQERSEPGCSHGGCGLHDAVSGRHECRLDVAVSTEAAGQAGFGRRSGGSVPGSCPGALLAVALQYVPCHGYGATAAARPLLQGDALHLPHGLRHGAAESAPGFRFQQRP